MSSVFKAILINKLSLKIIYLVIRFLDFRVVDNQMSFISYPDYSDNAWHLFVYMSSQCSNKKLVWLVDNIKDSIPEYYDNGMNDISFVKRYSMLGLYIFLKSKFVFHTHGTYFFIKHKINPILINLWHGMPLKIIGNYNSKDRDVYLWSDYHVATSQKYVSILSKSFGAKEESVLSFGLPRNDMLLKRSSNKTVMNRLDVHNCDKIVAWLPSYRISKEGDIRSDSNHSSFLECWRERELRALDDLLNHHRIFLIIKIHPMDKLNDMELPYDFCNIKLINKKQWNALGLDLYEFLSATDGLISDVSSVIIDYMLTGNPIGIIELTDEDYSRGFINDVIVNDNLEYHKITGMSSLVEFFSLKSIVSYKYPNIYHDSASPSIPKMLKYFKII
jgi:CDP-glycerol glycerophosphotransferase (TagB/SpsB family)